MTIRGCRRTRTSGRHPSRRIHSGCDLLRVGPTIVPTDPSDADTRPRYRWLGGARRGDSATARAAINALHAANIVDTVGITTVRGSEPEYSDPKVLLPEAVPTEIGEFRTVWGIEPAPDTCRQLGYYLSY